MPRSAILVFAFVALSPIAAWAQVAGGPGTGSPVQPLKVAAVTGPDAGQEVDVAARRAGQITIYAFVQADKWDRPLARFLKTLDQQLAGNRTDVEVIAIWLTADVAASKDYLARVQDSLSLAQTTLAVFPGDKNGPPAWQLSDSAHLTVVVASGGKVAGVHGFRSVNELDVPDVVAKIPAAAP